MGKKSVRDDINKAIDEKEGYDVWDKVLGIGAPALGAVIGGAALRGKMRKATGEELEGLKNVRRGEEVYDEFGGTHPASEAEARGLSREYNRRVNFDGRLGATAGALTGGGVGALSADALMRERSRRQKSRRK